VKKKLKIAFANFWKKHNVQKDIFFRLLSQKYDLEISDNPDILFFSVFGKTKDHFKYDCLSVFYTGENVKPDFRICDYAFSFEETDAKNFQLPCFVSLPFFQEFLTQRYGSEVKELRSHPKFKFCNFIYFNDKAKERIEFCKKLMSYRKVDCPGKVLNNMLPIDRNKPPGWNKRPHEGDWTGKLNFIKEYKFTISFENQSFDNYTTEKIYHPLLVGSIPIYWGNPKAAEYFNPSSFINCHDYDDFDQVIQRIIEIDNDDSLYRKYVTSSPLSEGSKLGSCTEETIMERLDAIINSIGSSVLVRKTFSYKYHKLFHFQLRINNVLREVKRRIGSLTNHSSGHSITRR